MKEITFENEFIITQEKKKDKKDFKNNKSNISCPGPPKAYF